MTQKKTSMNKITVETLMGIVGRVEMYYSEYQLIEGKFQELLKGEYKITVNKLMDIVTNVELYYSEYYLIQGEFHELLSQ